MKTYKDIVVDEPADKVTRITLNRPSAHNSITTHMLGEISECLQSLVFDEAVHCVVITGGKKVFAAGADLTEMSNMSMIDVLEDSRPRFWANIASFPKPVIAAVNGYALGGGCELAIHADIIIAGSNAQFGQPEINLGIIPGAGGTQRLIRSVGKALASKMVLTGEFIDAKTAFTAGLVSEITQPEMTIERAINMAKLVASKAPIAMQQAKTCLQKSYETTLSEGLDVERKAFVMLAGTDDRQEGISAFIEKRTPEFKGK